jgi:CubicO group peptidase (beta-lactamase class C family)
MVVVDGSCELKFREVKAVLARLIDTGQDIGASVAVTVDGHPVVDIWGGWSDEGRTRPWVSDTITNVWSTTKTVTALAALMLIDRGLLVEDDPVAKHWPEFAANGKEAITVGHIMSHTSGVAAWEQPVTIETVYDLGESTSRLAAQAPWWKPGSGSGYHAINYGQLIGEVVRRVSGKSLAEFVATEIAEPLGADFQIGARVADWDRISPVVAPPPLAMADALDPNGVALRTLTGPSVKAEYALTPEWRRAIIGGANGHSHARGVARIQSVVSNGGEIDGVRLLSKSTIDRIFRQYSDGVDLVLGIPVCFGLGYCLSTPEITYIPRDGVCFWGGWGGSLVVNDMTRKTTIAFMMNKMAAGVIGGPSAKAIFECVYAALA